MSDRQLEAYYGLPTEVVFCASCVMSNQKPNSTVEFQHTIESKKETIHIDEEGLCDACKANAEKHDIDWEAREEELLEVLDTHRRADGHYDCLVPGSGGKDSAFQAHVLKHKYGMNPLTVTWPPILYTEYGHRNFRNWLDVGGFDNGVPSAPEGMVALIVRENKEDAGPVSEEPIVAWWLGGGQPGAG